MFVDHDDRVVEMTAATTRWMVGRKFCRLLSCLIRRGTEFSPILPVLALSPRHRRRALAQLAEQRSPKPQVRGVSLVRSRGEVLVHGTNRQAGPEGIA